tara:strand:+ start:813 stop:989 length:177 start_codon:yes stop_codon:yes gene_type:complete
MTEEYLKAVITYIKEVEEKIDLEWGMGRPFDEIHSEGRTPWIYDETLRLLNGLPPDTN